MRFRNHARTQRLGGSNPRLTVFALLLVLLRLVAPSVTHSDQKKTSEKNFVWESDLKTAGYTPIAIKSDSESASIGDLPLAILESVRIGYLDPQTILLSYVDKNPNASAVQHRDDPNRVQPYVLHRLFINASTGALTSKLDWPSDIPTAFLIPRDDNQYVLFDAERVASFSRDGTQTAELSLQGPQQGILEIWGVSVSETGRTIFVQFHSKPTTSCEWVDTVEMTDTVSQCSLPHRVAITDSALAAVEVRTKPVTKGDVPPEPPVDGGLEICNSKKNPICKETLFVHQNLAVYADPGFVLLDGSQRPFFHKSFPENEMLKTIVGAKDSQRIAVESLPTLPRIPFVPGRGQSLQDIQARAGLGRLTVYEPPSDKWSYTIEFKTPIVDIPIALSPDGKQALILFGTGLLRAYSIP